MTDAPAFIPGDPVTLVDQRVGVLRLVVRTTEPATNGGPEWLTMTDKHGYGRWRRPSTDVKRGWGN